MLSHNTIRKPASPWGWAGSILAVLLVLAGTAYGTLVKTYDFSQDSVRFTQDTVDGIVYDVIRMANCNLDCRNLGAPQLPTREARFIIPYNEKLVSIEVQAVSAETLDGEYYPLPVQPPGCSVCTPQPFIPPDDRLYEAGFPSSHVEGGNEGYWANYRLVSFELRPLMYGPGRQLILVTQLTISINTTPDFFQGLPVARRTEFSDGQLRLTVGRIVDNPEALDYAFPVPIQAPSDPLIITPVPSSAGSPVDCLILAADQALSSCERYARFWTERGIVTTVRGIDWTDAQAQFHGRDKAESMRNFVKAAYQSWGTSFVILAGWKCQPEDNGVPSRHVPSMVAQSPEWTTTDQYFSDLDGSWDEDDDGVYGEPYLAARGMSSMHWCDPLQGRATAPRTWPYGSVACWTDDGGITWRAANHSPGGPYTDIYDMQFLTPQLGWCVGYDSDQMRQMRARVFQTMNGGRDWMACQTPEITGRLCAVHFADAYHGWAVGYIGGTPGGGIIFRSTDVGCSWQQVSAPTYAYLTDVATNTPTSCWVTTNTRTVRLLAIWCG